MQAHHNIVIFSPIFTISSAEALKHRLYKPEVEIRFPGISPARQPTLSRGDRRLLPAGSRQHRSLPRTPFPGALLRQLGQFIPIPTQESLTRPVPLVAVSWDFSKMSPLIITKARKQRNAALCSSAAAILNAICTSSCISLVDNPWSDSGILKIQ